MIRHALIKIRDSKNSGSDILTQGRVRHEGGAFYIEYGTDADKYVIGISGDIVTVSRIAAESYTMVLQESKPCSFDLETQYGSVILSLIPLKVSHSQTDDRLELHLKYELKTSANGAEETQAFSLDVECVYNDNLGVDI